MGLHIKQNNSKDLVTSSLKYVYDLGSKTSLYREDNGLLKTEALQVLFLCFGPNLKGVALIYLN